MRPAIDPRGGDIEDDASSSKRRSLLSLAGSLLAEISLPKLILAFTLLVVVPGLAGVCAGFARNPNGESLRSPRYGSSAKNFGSVLGNASPG